MTDSSTEPTVAEPSGIHHVRLTVTDIDRSKRFYGALLGTQPQVDMSDQVDDPEARRDPARLFAGCAFEVGDQLLALRPAAEPGDAFESTRVGLDHLSLAVASVDALEDAARRLDAMGATHGDLTPLEDMGFAILSVQDPDDINLELTAPLG